MAIRIFHARQEKIGRDIEKLEEDLNAFLKKHPKATVQWLQSSSGAGTGGNLPGKAYVVDLTAIVTY